MSLVMSVDSGIRAGDFEGQGVCFVFRANLSAGGYTLGFQRKSLVCSCCINTAQHVSFTMLSPGV